MSHEGKTYATLREIVADSIDTGAVDFTDQLDTASLTGTPTATISQTHGTANVTPLVVDTLARNSAEITVNSRAVAANKGVTFRIDASTCNAGERWDVIISCGHDAVSGGIKRLHCPVVVT